MMPIRPVANGRASSTARWLVCGIWLTLSACAPNTPHWDTQFGDAVRFAQTQQTINPEASLTVKPANGIDGMAARESVNRYRSSFKEPTPSSNTFTIGVGR
jgi:hypothetical protein